MAPSLKPFEPSGKLLQDPFFYRSPLTYYTCSYRSEDEEEEEEEDDDGSSVEEEEEEEQVAHHHSSVLGSNSNAALDLAPAYTQPPTGSNVQVGSNGYAVGICESASFEDHN
jgi:hypothetical protein